MMSKKVSIKQIANAFTPAKEISDAEKFAGRPEYVNDAILDRLVHSSHRIDLKGESLRKLKLNEPK